MDNRGRRIVKKATEEQELPSIRELFKSVVDLYSENSSGRTKLEVVVIDNETIKLNYPNLKGKLSLEKKGSTRFTPIARVGPVDISKDFVVARPKARKLLEFLLSRNELIQ